MSAVALAVSGWLVTYALHSVLLLMALVATERWWARSAAVGDLLYKVGAFAPLLTASLQVGLLARAPAVEPLGGRWELPPIHAAALPEISPIANPMPLEYEEIVAPPATPPAPATATEAGAPLPWYTLLVAAWLAGVVVSIVFFVRRYTRAHRRFAQRVAPNDPGLSEGLERLRASMGYALPVKLTVCDEVVSPVALNRAEICLPTGLLASLTRDQVESMLAHELAHLRRRDPTWLLAFGCLETVFYFQPLNRIARRRFQVYAERLCDQWSVDYAQRPLALAQCLTEVARWLRGAEAVPYPGMAESDSPLLSRVRRVLSGQHERLRPTYAARVAAVVAVASVLAIAPTVGGRVTAAVANAAEPARVNELFTQQTDIASAVRSLSNGTLRFAYDTRPSVCGTGEEKDRTRMIALQPAADWQPAGRADALVMWVIDGTTMMRHVIGTDGKWTTRCNPGVARIDLGVRNGRVESLSMSVADPAPKLPNGARDLGQVTTASAEEYLVALSRSAGPDLRERALIGAMLVRNGLTSAELSRLGREQPELAKEVAEWRGTLSVASQAIARTRDLDQVADLSLSMRQRLAALDRATRAGLSVGTVIEMYDGVRDRAMRVELIDWLGQRANDDVRRKLSQIVENAVVLEEQQAAVRVLREGGEEVVSNRPYNNTYAGAPQTALGRRVAAEDGIVRITYPARPEACGSGIDRDGAGMFALLPTETWQPGGAPGQAVLYSFDADDFTRLGMSPHPSWTSKCDHGFAHVLLTVRGRERTGGELTGGRVVNLQIIVGPEPDVPVDESLGVVTGPEAAAFLLELVRSAGQTIAINAILAAIIAAGDVPLYPELLRIATDSSRPERVRQTALHWVALDPTPGAKEALRRASDSLPQWRKDDGYSDAPTAIGESNARIMKVEDLSTNEVLSIALDNRHPLETRKKAVEWAAARGLETRLLISLKTQVADPELRAHIDRVIEKRK